MSTKTNIAARLGFRGDAGFVVVNRGGYISFTAGKPEEVRALLRACEREGLRPSRALREAAAR